jgi:putative peptidoglycan binding protein
MAFPVVPVALGGAGLFVGYKLFFEKPSVQRLTSRDRHTGASVDVAVPTTGDRPQSGASVVPPTSDDISQVPTEETFGPYHEHHRRHFLPPAIVPGELPMAPTVLTPFGPAPMVIRSPYDVQFALNALGHGPLPINGRIDPATTAAIMRFQTAHGLLPVGYHPDLGAHLQNAVQSVIPRPMERHAGVHFGAEPIVALAKPTTPVAVAIISKTPPIITPSSVQVALNKTGANPPLKVDGHIGPKTVAATKAFQVVHGLVVDGVPGPKTRTALALAAMPRPLCDACVATPYVDPYPIDPILHSRNEKFLHWAERHHLRAVNPLYHPRWDGASPAAIEKAWGPILRSRNEKFVRWAAKHHLESLVNCHRSPFGAFGHDGSTGAGTSDPAASTYFKSAHLPFGFGFGAEGATASFKNAHLPFGCSVGFGGEASYEHGVGTFGIEGAAGTNPAASAYFKHAHLPFGGEASYEGGVGTFGAFGGLGGYGPPGAFDDGTGRPGGYSHPAGGGDFAHAHTSFGVAGSGGRGQQSGPSVHAAAPTASPAAHAAPPPPSAKTVPAITKTAPPTIGPQSPAASIAASPPPPGQGHIAPPAPIGPALAHPAAPTATPFVPSAGAVVAPAPPFSPFHPQGGFSPYLPPPLAPTYDNPYGHRDYGFGYRGGEFPYGSGGGGGYFEAFRAAETPWREQAWVDSRDAVIQEESLLDEISDFFGDSVMGTSGKHRKTGHGQPRHRAFG